MSAASLPYVVDHVFICTSPGGPAAEHLKAAGLLEGTPNQHPGQGTACRRFFFSNCMLELIWLQDAAEARSEQTRATQLWERLSGAGETASPFGFILRPAAESEPASPWRTWRYRPPAMPALDFEIASDIELAEPMWCYVKGGSAPLDYPPERRQPLDHPAGFREVTRIVIVCPEAKPDSVTMAMAANGLIGLQTGIGHLLELEFDSGRLGRVMDFRPHLPLIFRV